MATVAPMSWEDHQAWEREWWGECLNTFGEETKQITYAHRMGLLNKPVWETWPLYDLDGDSILDLGGGPVSMLLKTVNGDLKTVVDPCYYPSWVADRYDVARIEYVVSPAEGWSNHTEYDECWIYNVLQHVQDPQAVLDTARRHAPVLRLFEWVDVPVCPGHPHTLRAWQLDEWLNAEGTVEQMNENGCVGNAYYGEFTL